MNELEQLKETCAELGVKYSEIRPGEPSLSCLRGLEAKICLRTLNRLAPTVAASDDSTFYADFKMLCEIFGRNTPLAWDQEDESIRRDLQLRLARRSRACPYTAEQYDAAVAKAGTKQELLAAELSVDRKTLRKYGRPSS